MDRFTDRFVVPLLSMSFHLRHALDDGWLDKAKTFTDAMIDVGNGLGHQWSQKFGEV